MQIEPMAGNINKRHGVDMPSSAAQRISPQPCRDAEFSLLLGNDYERKKKKLMLELQLDYKEYIAKKKDVKTSEPRPQPQGLSLPIDERISVQNKLREERKKEYNLFQQEKAQREKSKRGTPLQRYNVTSKPEQVEALDAMYVTSPASLAPIISTHTDTHPRPRACPASRGDAATLTDTEDNGKSTRTGPGHLGRRRWQLVGPKEPHIAEEEPITVKEDELEFRHRRRQDRHTPEPGYKEERRTRDHSDNRAPQDIKTMEATGVHDQNNNAWIWKSDLEMPNRTMTAARSKPATGKVQFATGLMIGAAEEEEQAAAQMKKEQYKQELLEQIAEQKKNKLMEKTLAATGATDLEKQPDRIKQLGPANRQYDSWRQDVSYKPRIDPEAAGKEPNPRPKDDINNEAMQRRGPPGNHSTALGRLTGKTTLGSGTRAAQGVPVLDYFNTVYHRDYSNVLGEVANPRVADVPPPGPTAVTNSYETPYDAAYYYYGSRNPLDLNLPHSQNLPDDLRGGVQQSENVHSPPQRPPRFRPSGHTEAKDQHQACPMEFGELPEDKYKQSRERALILQEALIQQIKEKEERKRREKEEKERYDAKIEAEIMAYNPWGRSGGGAPLKDQQGNLVSNLDLMHRANNELNRNPMSRSGGRTQSSPGDKDRTPLPNRLPDFIDRPTPQQLHTKNRYKEELKEQIKEDRRKRIEEAKRMRMEEEKAEKKVAEQRAHIKQQYEEEQRKQRRAEQNQDRIQEPETQPQEEEKRAIQEEEIEKKVPERAVDREEKNVQLSSEQREPPPPVPALQRKLKNASRPSSTESSASAAHSRPVPAEIPQLQDGQEEVIKQLSVISRHLRKEQRRLQAQIDQTDQDPPHRPGGRPRGKAFESTDKQAVQPSTRSPFSGDNVQNIRQFNKYTDSASGENVRHIYPDELDIQQQELLRERRRKIGLSKRAEEHGQTYLRQDAADQNGRPGAVW